MDKPLVGLALIKKTQEYASKPEDEIAIACGYIDSNGIILREEFYRALAELLSSNPYFNVSMENIEFEIEGYVKFASPIDHGINKSESEKKFIVELTELIKKEKFDDATNYALNLMTAEYCIFSVKQLYENGFRFNKTKSFHVKSPFLEGSKNGEQWPAFRWMGACFLIEGPKSIVENWTKKNTSGDYRFSEDLFEQWMEENGDDYLQDGCCYTVGETCYDLQGIGTNAASINGETIEDAFNNH